MADSSSDSKENSSSTGSNADPATKNGSGKSGTSAGPGSDQTPVPKQNNEYKKWKSFDHDTYDLTHGPGGDHDKFTPNYNLVADEWGKLAESFGRVEKVTGNVSAKLTEIYRNSHDQFSGAAAEQFRSQIRQVQTKVEHVERAMRRYVSSAKNIDSGIRKFAVEVWTDVEECHRRQQKAVDDYLRRMLPLISLAIIPPPLGFLAGAIAGGIVGGEVAKIRSRIEKNWLMPRLSNHIKTLCSQYATNGNSMIALGGSQLGLGGNGGGQGINSGGGGNSSGGSSYGPGAGNPYAQGMGNPYGQELNNPYGQGMVIPQGQGPGDPYGQGLNNPYGQGTGNPYGQGQGGYSDPYGAGGSGKPYGSGGSNGQGAGGGNGSGGTSGTGNSGSPGSGGQQVDPTAAARKKALADAQNAIKALQSEGASGDGGGATGGGSGGDPGAGAGGGTGDTGSATGGNPGSSGGATGGGSGDSPGSSGGGAIPPVTSTNPGSGDTGGSGSGGSQRQKDDPERAARQQALKQAQEALKQLQAGADGDYGPGSGSGSSEGTGGSGDSGSGGQHGNSSSDPNSQHPNSTDPNSPEAQEKAQRQQALKDAQEALRKLQAGGDTDPGSATGNGNGDPRSEDPNSGDPGKSQLEKYLDDKDPSKHLDPKVAKQAEDDIHKALSDLPHYDDKTPDGKLTPYAQALHDAEKAALQAVDADTIGGGGGAGAGAGAGNDPVTLPRTVGGGQLGNDPVVMPNEPGSATSGGGNQIQLDNNTGAQQGFTQPNGGGRVPATTNAAVATTGGAQQMGGYPGGGMPMGMGGMGGGMGGGQQNQQRQPEVWMHAKPGAWTGDDDARANPEVIGKGN
ncbi:hypothetical protein [Amycolatopsis sp. NPDC059021]|uniref:hypothetical protein n=1 Tax=Amycolatopsis sp. NPDC059021 TaxID=3346704 RepID=UPI003671D3B5